MALGEFLIAVDGDIALGDSSFAKGVGSAHDILFAQVISSGLVDVLGIGAG